MAKTNNNTTEQVEPQTEGSGLTPVVSSQEVTEDNTELSKDETVKDYDKPLIFPGSTYIDRSFRNKYKVKI